MGENTQTLLSKIISLARNSKSDFLTLFLCLDYKVRATSITIEILKHKGKRPR